MKILLAIDGSTFSDAAVREVARRPWPPQTEVRLITVETPLEPALVRGEPASVLDDLVKLQRAESVRRLNEAAAVLKEQSPELCVNPVLREGWPKDVILDEAERWGADLIVVGSHGYGAFRRLFLGSVSLAVATNALCSVEIVRVSAAS
jgi:nucleotide-binding universal stress UspA family protein